MRAPRTRTRRPNTANYDINSPAKSFLGVNPGFIYYIYYLPALHDVRPKSEPITAPEHPKMENPKGPEYLAAIPHDEAEIKEWVKVYDAKIPQSEQRKRSWSDFGASYSASSSASSMVEQEGGGTGAKQVGQEQVGHQQEQVAGAEGKATRRPDGGGRNLLKEKLGGV